MTLKIKLFAIEQDLYDAWKQYLGDLDFVSIYKGNILNEPTDAIISPANSFGFMDGGIDLHYRNFFGRQLQTKLQEQIKLKFNGELLVGQATSVETDNDKIKFLIAAPTMRLPTRLNPGTENPYLAMKAVLRIIKDINGVSISVPGLATGVGGVPANVCAMQVRHAINEVLLGQYKFPEKFQDAVVPGTYRTLGDWK